MVFEVADKILISEKTDVWGFSYILLEMLTNLKLGTYKINDKLEYYKNLERILKSLSNLKEESLSTLILQGLVYDAENRHTMTEYHE